MTSKYVFIGEHPETLASGRPVAPGDEVEADAVDPKHEVDRRLLDEELLVQLEEQTPAKTARQGGRKEQNS